MRRVDLVMSLGLVMRRAGGRRGGTGPRRTAAQRGSTLAKVVRGARRAFEISAEEDGRREWLKGSPHRESLKCHREWLQGRFARRKRLFLALRTRVLTREKSVRLSRIDAEANLRLRGRRRGAALATSLRGILRSWALWCRSTFPGRKRPLGEGINGGYGGCDLNKLMFLKVSHSHKSESGGAGSYGVHVHVSPGKGLLDRVLCGCGGCDLNNLKKRMFLTDGNI